MFIDLEKAYDRIPKDIIWWPLHEKVLTRRYIDVFKDMYDRAMTTIRTSAEESSEFSVTADLHQGSTLSPYLFALVIDELTGKMQDEVP